MEKKRGWRYVLEVLGIWPFKIIGVRSDGCIYPTGGTIVSLVGGSSVLYIAIAVFLTHC